MRQINFYRRLLPVASAFALLLAVLAAPLTAHAKIYIRIDQFSKEKFPIALTLFQNKSKVPGRESLAGDIDAILERDLTFTSLFRFVPKKSFLEDPSQSGNSASSIDFANWAVIDAQALVKGWYLVDKNNAVTVEFYLFDVLSKSQMLSRKYTEDMDSLPTLIHRIADDIIKELTGEEGIFGTKIAFIGNQTGNKELYMMDLDGRNVLRLTSNRSINLSPDWARDGHRIAFTSFKGGKGSQLFIADLRSKSIQGFDKLSGTIIGPAFNPDDGNMLALTLSAKFDRGIYLFGIDRSSLKKVTKGNSIDVSPSFSPDGKEIIFSSNRSGNVHIYKKGLNSDEEAKRITFEGTRNVDPDWSPKGDKIAFTGMDSDGYFDIFVMNQDGSGITRLTYDSKNNEHPSFSPDGQYIIFASNRSGKYQLYVMRPVPQSDQFQITFSNFDHTMPSWSPRLKN